MFQSVIAQEIHLREIRSGLYAQAPSAAGFDKDLVFAMEACSSPDFTTVMLYDLQSIKCSLEFVQRTFIHSLVDLFLSLVDTNVFITVNSCSLSLTAI